MLLSVTGASGAGKSTAFDALVSSLDGELVACVEFDRIGIPADADTAWRHGALERWVRRAIEEQRAGRHLVLCGQVPPGELLAAPSAAKLDGIAACVLHCSPAVRRQRLIGRGDDPDALDDHVAFGEWFYRHTSDPTYMPEVIRVAGPPMEWDRWAGWAAGDPRWAFTVIDTDDLSREQVGGRVVAWARDVLAGSGPVLSGAWF